MSLMNKMPAAGISQNQARYNQARYSLLLIMIFSVINIFTVSFGNSYFLFSSYFTTMIADTGAFLAQETELQLYLYVAIVIAVISIIPYLLCWIFSKKHNGWMIAGLVLISADTALLLYDLLSLIVGGYEFGSYIIDVAFHAYIIYSLAVGVKFGKLLKAEKDNPAPAQENAQEDLLSDSSSDYADEGMGDFERTITVIRPKKLTGFAIELVCRIDGVEKIRVKNGQTASFTVNGNSHRLTVFNPATNIESDAIVIPAGYEPHTYSLEFKSDMTIVTINIREINATIEQ